MKHKKLIAGGLLALQLLSFQTPLLAATKVDEDKENGFEYDYSGDLESLNSSLKETTAVIQSIKDYIVGSDADTISGVGLLNEMSRAFDYKPSQKSFMDKIVPQADIVEKLTGNSERYTADAIKYTGDAAKDEQRQKIDQPVLYWLITNNIIERDISLSIGTSTRSVVRENNGALIDLSYPCLEMRKTDFLMNAYKALYGPIQSRPVAFQTNSVRDGKTMGSSETYDVRDEEGYRDAFTGQEKKADYKDSGWDFSEGDYLAVVTANVRELYLAELLNMGIIKEGEISSQNFLDSYHKYASLDINGNSPSWDSGNMAYYGNQGRVHYNQKHNSQKAWSEWDEKTENLPWGESYIYQDDYSDSRDPDSGSWVFLEEISKLSYREVQYFREEQLPESITLLKYVEKLLRLKEDMTDTEARIIAYKYGVNFLNKIPEEDRTTVTYLVAKGILSFENSDDFSKLYVPMTNEFAYMIFYRLANENARTTFKDVQLTDSDNFWIEQGFGESKLNIVSPATESEKFVIPNIYTDKVTTTGAQPQEEHWQTASVQKSSFVSKLLGERVAYAAPSMKEYEVTKKFSGDADQLQYRGFTLYYMSQALSSNSDQIPELVSVSPEPPNETASGDYTITFKIKASSEYLASMAIDSNLTILPMVNSESRSIVGVSRVKTGDNDPEITLIPANTLSSISSDLVILEDKLLKNKKTNTMAVLLPDHHIALVGNEVIKSEKSMVKAIDGRVYYDLEIIKALMSQTYISTLNENVLYSGTALNEEVVPINTRSNDTLIAKTYVADFKSREHIQKESEWIIENTTAKKSYYNLTLASQCKNSIVYKYRLPQTTDNSAAVGDDSITVIVDFKYMIPQSSSIMTEEVIKAVTGKDWNSSEVSIKDVNNILMKRPGTGSNDAQSLSAWWDCNIALSNALCNVIYGKMDTGNYIQCGYLVPNIYILYNKSGNYEEIIKQFLKDVDANLSAEYKRAYVDKMKAASTVNSLLKDSPKFATTLYNAAPSGSKAPLWQQLSQQRFLSLCEGSSLDNGCISYMGDRGIGSGNFIVTASGSVYRAVDDDDDIKYSNKKLFINDLMNAETDSNKIFVGAQVYRETSNGSVPFTYLGNNGPYMRLLCQTPVEGNIYFANVGDGDDTYPTHVLLEQKGSSLKDAGYEYYSSLSKYFEDKDNKDVVRDYTVMVKNGLLYDNRSAEANKRISDYIAKSSGRIAIVGCLGQVIPYFDRIKHTIDESTYSSNKKPIEKSGKLPVAYTGIKGLSFTRLDVYRSSGIKIGYDMLGNKHIYHPTQGIGWMVLEVSNNSFKINENKQIVPQDNSPYLTGVVMYPSSINQGMIDRLISETVKTYKLGSLPLGAYVYINGALYFKTGKSELTSLPIATANLIHAVDNVLSQPGAQQSEIQKAIVKAWGGASVTVRGLNVSAPLSSYVQKADLGYFNKAVHNAYKDYLTGTMTSSNFLYSKMAVIKKGNIACKIGAKYLIDKDGGKNTIPYNEAAAKSIIISVTLDPDMLCTVFDNDNKVYNMLLSVPSLSEGYIDNLPFFESLTIDSKDAIALNSNKVQFRPLAYANEIRNQFLEDHRKAFAGDLKKLFKVICIDIMCYVVVMSWVGYAIITYRVGYSVLEVIYKPFANSTKGGIDLLKIFTLGIYNMESEPSFPILFGGNLLLVFLVYVIFTYF